MTPIRIRPKIDSETLHLPELRSLVGRTVEITISEKLEPATAVEFYATAGHVPSSEAEWAGLQATFRSWRADSRFEPFWPIIDRLLSTDFAATRRWAAAAEAARGLEGYDVDAWRQQREFDLKHTDDHLP